MVESEEDRIAMLEDFGEPCTVNGTPGVLLIFREQHIDVPLGDGQFATGVKETALGLASDLVGVRKGWTVLRGSTSYAVIGDETDGTGFVRLILQSL